jgi:hypothetical protein
MNYDSEPTKQTESPGMKTNHNQKFWELICLLFPMAMVAKVTLAKDCM